MASVLGLLTNVNASKLLLGVAALTFNFGSRFVLTDLTPAQLQMIQHPFVKRAIVFCMYFVTTRDVLLSATLALLTIVALEAFLNEGSRFCIMPGARCTAAPPSLARLPVLPMRPLASALLGKRGTGNARPGRGGGGGKNEETNEESAGGGATEHFFAPLHASARGNGRGRGRGTMP
jgi:hypothetical protein